MLLDVDLMFASWSLHLITTSASDAKYHDEMVSWASMGCIVPELQHNKNA